MRLLQYISETARHREKGLNCGGGKREIVSQRKHPVRQREKDSFPKRAPTSPCAAETGADAACIGRPSQIPAASSLGASASDWRAACGTGGRLMGRAATWPRPEQAASAALEGAALGFPPAFLVPRPVASPSMLGKLGKEGVENWLTEVRTLRGNHKTINFYCKQQTNQRTNNSAPRSAWQLLIGSCQAEHKIGNWKQSCFQPGAPQPITAVHFLPAAWS